MLICGAVGYALEVLGRICIAGKGAFVRRGKEMVWGALNKVFPIIQRPTMDGLLQLFVGHTV